MLTFKCMRSDLIINMVGLRKANAYYSDQRSAACYRPHITP